MAEATPSALRRAPLDWTSDDPHLMGNFMPIGPEIDADDLPVIAGHIPADLSGTYLRNGPNPEFKPISYTYPMDGDGMIHAVRFANGKARYRNRFVRTRGLEAERRAGRALYGGVMRPVEVDPALIGPDGDPGPFKTGAFISVLHHAGHLLALNEASPAYEMTMDLDTLGEWRPGTAEPISIGAHNRRHPRSGSMFGISYRLTEPVVDLHEIGADGTLRRSIPVTLAAPSMIHDFVLTEGHVVLLVGPAIFDLEAAQRGEPMLQWRPQLGTRIGILPIDGGTPRWIEADPFFVFHFANGFERGSDIVIDYVQHERLSIGDGGGPHEPPRMHRLVIDTIGMRIGNDALADFVAEFPRINDALEALPSRLVYVPTRSDSLRLENPPSAVFNTIVKLDAATGATWRHDLGNRIAGEPVFIPRGGGAEDDGYLVVYAYDPVAGTSDLVLLDAARIGEAPVAVIRLPQRVPQGLHGTWVPGA
jgi:carotenoid cleavage dioxygenase-like enzyme